MITNIGTLDVLQACDACADVGMTYSVIVQCTDCVVFPNLDSGRYGKSLCLLYCRQCYDGLGEFGEEV